jgi:predicted nucleotidyltransferase
MTIGDHSMPAHGDLQKATSTILKVLVGSQAHGLTAPGSDADYRSVFVIPTEALFRLEYRPPASRWSKGNGDETAWEIGPFLSLAVQCHPLVLETFLAPVVAADEWGIALRSLFPAVWEPKRAYDAFVGYAMNQRTKCLEKKDGRPEKYAAACVRVLYNLCELLETGTFTVRIADAPIGKTIARLKNGECRTGEVIDLAEQWTHEAEQRLDRCAHQADRPAVNAYLVKIRTAFLDGRRAGKPSGTEAG